MRSSSHGSTTALPRALLVITGLLLTARLVVAVMPHEAPPELVEWRDAVSNAEAVSASASRPVLYYFGAHWCAPCRQLDERVFRDPAVAKLINDRFVPVRVKLEDSPDDASTTILRQLMSRHGIVAYPTVVIERPGASPIKISGFHASSRMRALLHSALPPEP